MGLKRPCLSDWSHTGDHEKADGGDWWQRNNVSPVTLTLDWSLAPPPRSPTQPSGGDTSLPVTKTNHVYTKWIWRIFFNFVLYPAVSYVKISVAAQTFRKTFCIVLCSMCNTCIIGLTSQNLNLNGSCICPSLASFIILVTRVLRASKLPYSADMYCSLCSLYLSAVFHNKSTMKIWKKCSRAIS